MPKADRIQFDFTVGNTRYRPTLDLPPTQANLRHAKRQLATIKSRIANGTFSFSDEFPDYRFIDKVATAASRPTFGTVADKFLQSIGDLEYATRESYRKILSSFWRPKIGVKPIDEIKYSDLAAIVGGHPWGSTKTRNNVVSVGRRVFDFHYADIENKSNPAEKLKSLRVQRQPPDPYTIEEANELIAELRTHCGNGDANYFEFGFFAGVRPSEAIALLWDDVDLKRGTVRISKARVMAQDKGRTKTAVVRDIELCPRALDVLNQQRTLTGLAGKQVFGPYHDLQIPWKRWAFAHKRLTIRYREPYQVRHTSVSWNLMIGKNLLWVAQQHGHSAAVMLKVYAKWITGSTDEDVDNIKMAMGYVKQQSKPLVPDGQKERDRTADTIRLIKG